MISEKQIEAGREVLRKYLLPDSLKPQYDGKTMYEIAKEVLERGLTEDEMIDTTHDCTTINKGFCDGCEQIRVLEEYKKAIKYNDEEEARHLWKIAKKKGFENLMADVWLNRNNEKTNKRADIEHP